MLYRKQREIFDKILQLHNPDDADLECARCKYDDEKLKCKCNHLTFIVSTLAVEKPESEIYIVEGLLDCQDRHPCMNEFGVSWVLIARWMTNEKLMKQLREVWKQQEQNWSKMELKIFKAYQAFGKIVDLFEAEIKILPPGPPKIREASIVSQDTHTTLENQGGQLICKLKDPRKHKRHFENQKNVTSNAEKTFRHVHEVCFIQKAMFFQPSSYVLSGSKKKVLRIVITVSEMS